MARPDPRSEQNANPPEQPGLLARMALALTDWTERWVPDAFVFALVATLIVVVAGVAFTPSSVPQVIDAWGRGFWELIRLRCKWRSSLSPGTSRTSQPVGGSSPRSGVADDAAQRRRAGSVLRHGELMVQLGVQPHL